MLFVINHSKLHLYSSLVFVIFSSRFIISEPTYVTSECFDDKFTLEASFSSNLNKLLSSLPEIAGQSINNGYNATNSADLAAIDSEKVYVLFLCQGDATSDDCKGCVSDAADKIQSQCPNAKRAVIWYDTCMVRYSNTSFLGDVDENIQLGLANTEYFGTDVNKFMNLTGNTLYDLASKLGKSEDNPRLLGVGDRKYYLTKGDVVFNSLIKLYTRAQCTPDLTAMNCQKCLTIMLTKMATYCNGSKGCQMMNPSCNTRYEVYRFYKDIASPVSPPPVAALSPPPRTTPPPPVKEKSQTGRSIIVNFTLGILVLILVVLVTVLTYLQCKKRKENNDAESIRNNNSQRSRAPNFYNVGEDNFMTAESLQHDFATLKFATNNFSDVNKLGEGGFGIVYKGTLPNGREVAVKRLSTGSHQGEEQFKNEVVFVAKLQHKNLVQLLGFCLTANEKLLVYEFVRNTSLDVILFDPERQGLLDWSARYRIIHGIARGILYLHEDSRLKIVHRDLKASNILLDSNMNPKISDFGLARNFAVNQEQDQTNRVAGTFGYMAPEYIEYGEISTKSDVYSFGVLVLEIITGKKISNRQTTLAENLLTYVWRHWRELTPLEAVDASLGDSYSSSEVVRCLHLGLLCVQGDVEERPCMLSIVSCLNSNSDLPMPQQPAAFTSSVRKGPNSGTRELTDRSTKSGSSSRTSGQQSDKCISRSIDSFSGIEFSSN
ncbi:cysteine-rich receptor-like protein kinase 5 isoform X1 [Chenopodium quinoa]|uniref:cysteine-rich receptor-like protein kinase 5 isoform X1 n=1 Tax=Chenopodium quinoa TaxID=63459 RepID=UPI000B790637|nr:cysteine-rich receptor-like protein kinase 5 isoform X1 [Chenopodium quinoa]